MELNGPHLFMLANDDLEEDYNVMLINNLVLASH
jgi:hypothetical protein